MLACRDEKDSQLLLSVVQGNSEAMKPLLQRWEKRVYGLCLQVLRSESDAADAAQQCWIQVWKHAASFDSERSFSAWLAKIAINAARMLARQRGHDVLFQASADDLQLLTSNSVVSSFEEAEDLQSLLAHLDARQQTVLYMKHGLGFTYAEIAEATGLKRSHISVLLCRGRQTLRDLYSQRIR